MKTSKFAFEINWPLPKSQIDVDPITIMDLKMHYDVRQRKKEKKHTTMIKLLLDAGLLFVFQHYANNNFLIVWLYIATK